MSDDSMDDLPPEPEFAFTFDRLLALIGDIEDEVRRRKETARTRAEWGVVSTLSASLYDLQAAVAYEAMIEAAAKQADG